MGSAASMIGALSAAPLYAWLGGGPAFLIGAITMAVLLTLSWLLDPPPTSEKQVDKTPRVGITRPRDWNFQSVINVALLAFSRGGRPRTNSGGRKSFSSLTAVGSL